MQYRRRLRSRIIISFALLGFVLTALFAAATLWLRETLENQLIAETLQREVDAYVADTRRDPDNPYYPFSRIEGWIFSQRRFANVPFEWRGFPTGVHEVREAGAPGEEPRRFFLAVRRDPDLWAFLRYDISQEEISAQQLQFALFAAVAAFSLLALLLGVWSSTRVMHPVSDLAARLRSFGSGGGAQPEPLAPYFADDEVGQLAAALDDYAARMTALVRRDREFNADVSHELRTPLAVIRGAVELLLSQPNIDDKTLGRLKRIERAVVQCTDLTGSLLMLSRGERAHGATDLRKLVESLADANRIALGNKPITLIVEGEDGVLIDAPEAVMAVALGNLLGNACKYTSEGEIRVSVFDDRVEIRDSGPGIDSEDAGRLFERGFRGKTSEGSRGAGIGLAIVTRLCELYGWDASIAPHPEGGALAILRFNPPRAGRITARSAASASA
jgi:signal transduction histidine kinase